MFKVIGKINSLSSSDQFRCVVIILLSSLVRIGVLLFTIKTLLRLFGFRPIEPPVAKLDKIPEHQLLRAHHIGQLVAQVCRYTPWQSNCIIQSAITCLLLRWSGINSGITVGARKLDQVFEAHAWVLVGNDVVNGAEGLSTFVPVSHFGKLEVV